MKSFAFFALLLCSANVLAQTPAEQIAKLQNDPNIIWIGEFYRDYEDLDNGYEGRTEDRYLPDTLPDGSILHNHRQNTNILKLERKTSAAIRWEYYFWAQIIDPKTKTFADADLTKPLTADEKTAYFIHSDTIIMQCAETYDPNWSGIITSEVSPQNIYGYRLRQLVYYNAQENMYYNLPLSIAPLEIRIDNNDKKQGLKQLFWLPVIASSTPIVPSKADNMPFIKSVQMHFPFADAKVLKESKKSEEVNQIWFTQIEQQKDKLFATANTDDENNKQLLPQDIYNALMDIHPEIKPSRTVVKKNFDVVDLRINQTFGWDDKKKTLTVATYSIAPIANRYDYNKTFLFSAPCFYIYPHRRFKIAK
jgi:hypothetical protein